MIKSLRQARITDGLPRVLARQEWVIALSEALGLALGKTLDYTDESQIYTRLDTAPEAVLDVLAVDWKIDWYDTELTVEQKRRIVKTALTVRRLMGTAAAVKLQVHAIYPEATVTEWFQYDGRPGCFRVSLPLPKEGITAAEYRRLKTGILTTKNERSHLDVIDIQHECEAVVITGGCCSMSQIIEVWPELVSETEEACAAAEAVRLIPQRIACPVMVMTASAGISPMCVKRCALAEHGAGIHFCTANLFCVPTIKGIAAAAGRHRQSRKRAAGSQPYAFRCYAAVIRVERNGDFIGLPLGSKGDWAGHLHGSAGLMNGAAVTPPQKLPFTVFRRRFQSIVSCQNIFPIISIACSAV